MRTNADEYRGWFKKAVEDEQSIQAILDAGGASSTACFLSQQMAEKYLKGLLSKHREAIQKVHDLLQLETLLLEHVPTINDIHEDLVVLNRYYIETRYPGDYPEFTRSESEEAFAAAKRVKDSVQKLLPA